MMIEKKKILSTLVIITLIATVFFNVQTSTVVLKPFVMFGSADTNCANNDSSWHNESYLNVTIESKRPRILWYDVQKCTSFTSSGETGPADIDGATWISVRNNMTETDNETWYRFIINVSSDQGWDNIEYINISGWHDNGSDTETDGSLSSTTGYNRTGNEGANRNFFFCYDNTTNVTGTYTMIYPTNGTEITLGNYSENNVTDVLGIDGQTETHNISFVFKPGYQFRYAPGPGESSTWTNHSVSCDNGMPSGTGFDATTWCWESFDNTWSWNFNITVENCGENWNASSGDGDGTDRYKSWVRDEFGIYAYTEIVSADSADIFGAPGTTHSTNGSSWYNSNFNDDNSENVTVRTRSNGNYSMSVNISDLRHIAVINGDVPLTDSLKLDNKTIWVRGGNRSTSLNFSDTGRQVIWLYGLGNDDGSVDDSTQWQEHEVNGTCKYTGEATIADGGPAAKSEQFPNGYGYSSYGSHNGNSTTIEFKCYIPAGQMAGKYQTHVYYHLRTQTH